MLFSSKGRLGRWSPWLVGTVALLVAGLGLYFFTGSAESSPSRAPEVGPGDIAVGPADAEVVLIEYSDFECQYCAEYAQILAPLREKYKDKVLFVFRFFPLANHRYGGVSAQAAYAAFLQDRFWEMHDTLYTNQQDWIQVEDPTLNFEAYATLLGLDLAKFKQDLQAQSTIDFIENQRKVGEQAGIDHTPWFIINGSVVMPRTQAEFETLIEAQL